MVSVSEPTERPWIELFGSRHLPQWLANLRLSLAFTTYQTGKLFLLGTDPEGRLSTFERTFDRAMGLWADGASLWLGTRFQVWRLENVLAPGQMHEDRDRLYVPRAAHVTGDIDLHDLAVEGTGRLVFVATSFSCVGTLSERHSLRPLWKPGFISRLAPEDRCHLNGLALRDGKVRYVTAMARTDVADGWRSRRHDGGCVLDVASGAVVAVGLSMPHSPRWHREQLWVLNSGKGELGRVDLATGRFEPIAFCPGYLRGLTFVGDYAIVSLSQPRREKTFEGLPLEEELARRGAEPQCGLQVIDLRNGDVAHWLKVEGMVNEIYDVACLPGAIRPMALGLKTDEIQRLLTLDEEGRL